MEKSKILHKEILEEVLRDINAKYKQDMFESESITNLIKQSMNICSNAGLRGRNNANIQIKEEIEKLLNDKTAKRQDTLQKQEA